MQSRKQSKRQPGNEAMCVYVGVGVFIQQIFLYVYCKKKNRRKIKEVKY